MTNNGRIPNEMDALAMLLSNPEGLIDMLERVGVAENPRKVTNEKVAEKINEDAKVNAKQAKPNTQEKRPHGFCGFPFVRTTESIATTIWADGDLTYIMMELAGFNKENIEVTYTDNILNVVARRQLPSDCIVCEMANTKCRQINVGYNHTNDDFKVSYENGILKITINNAPAKKAVGKIAID